MLPEKLVVREPAWPGLLSCLLNNYLGICCHVLVMAQSVAVVIYTYNRKQDTHVSGSGYAWKNWITQHLVALQGHILSGSSFFEPYVTFGVNFFHCLSQKLLED